MKMGWDWRPLGEVCKTGSGATPLKTFKEYYEGGAIPWLLSGEVAQGEITEAKNFITESGLKNSAAKLFPVNSVLIAMYGATAGQVGILRFESATNQAVCAILPNPRFVPEFLFYVFLHLKEKLIATATGNAQPNISQIKIKNTVIPIPPLDEQRRIVAVLDKAFANIATATANAQKNLTNARALFESYLRSVFDAPNVDWQQSTLGKLTSKIGSGATPRGGKDAYKADGTPLIRSMNVHDRYFKDRNLAFIDDNQARLLNNVIVQENDVLLNITGASVARCCLAPQDMAGARVNQHVAIIRAYADKIRPEFLELALTSPHYKDILLGVGEKGGSTRQAITKAEIQSLEVAFPALIDQNSFVDHATELQIETRKLATIANQKLTVLTELKQSLLQKAFAGELT